MKIMQWQRKIWFKLITNTVITTMLCQNVVWAGGGSAYRNIAPRSIFENFDKYFEAKGIDLPFHIKSKIFLGFTRISEKVFSLPPKDQDKLLESNNPYKEIENVFRYTDQNFEKYINFIENSIKIQTDENGNKFFSIDIEFIQSNRKRIPHNVIFYDSNRPPYKNLQGLSTTWTEIDEQYARERGFWISNLTTYDNYQSIPRMTLERGRIKSVFPFLSDSGIEEAIRRLRIIKEIKAGIPVKGAGGIVTGEEIKPLIDFVKEQVSKLNVGKIISIMLTGSYPWSKSPYDIDIMVYCENPPFSGKPDWLKVLQFAEKPNPDIGEVNAKLKFPEGIKPITSRLTISIFGGESRGFPALWRNTIHIDGEKIDFPCPSDEDIMKYLINILNSLDSLMEQGSFSKVLSRLIRIYMLIDELKFSSEAKVRGFNLMQWYEGFGDEEIPSFKFRERLEAEINYFKELVKPKGEVSSIEISLNEALGILDAFLKQTEDIPQPEFVGFGWGKEQITREFIQEYLPEILGLAKNELIAAHQLPDGRIRFTKLKEIYFSKKNGKSGGNVEEYLQAPEVQCPFGKSESFIIESILNLRKDFILSLLDSEKGQIWLIYCLRKVFVFDPPFKIKEIFLWAIMSGKDRIFTKLFYKALQDIDPAKAGLIVLFLLELCGEAEVIQELKQKKDELEFNIAILKDLLEEIALKWQLDQKDVPYLKVFFYKNLKNRGFLKQINMCSGEDENSCYLINEEIGTIVEITGDSPMNVIRIISEGLESSRLKFYFPDDLIPYIEYLLNLEDFYFPFREKIESEIKKRKSERRVITPKIRFMDLESLYKSTISGSHDKCNTEDFLLNYADNLRDAGIKDSDLIMEGIVLKHREICILLVPDIAESSVWEKRRCPYKVMGFIEGDYLYPLERDKRKIVENYLLSLPATEIKHYLCLSNRVGLLSPDVFVDLTTSDRDEIYIGHDLALENEVTEAIKDIDGSISIVDIGMGGGELLNRLTNRFSGDRRIKYFGNEPDPKLLKLAKLRLPEYVRLFSVDGEYLSQADFIEDLKGTYKIAILEGILTRGVTEPSKGQEILEGLFKIGFDRIFITGHTPVYINYEELETVLKKFGYKLERTLYPQNLFNFNKPKIMFVFCKVNRPALETFQVNDSNNKEKGPGIKSKPISDKPITEYRLDIQITKNGIFDLGRNEKNIIPGDSPLIFLGKELGVNFYVPISEKKEGYWKYKLNLTEYERKTIMEYDILPAYVEDKPTDIYIAFHNDIPLCIFCCDGISMLCYGIDPDLILNPLHSIASLWPKGDLIYPIVPADELFYYVRTKNMDRICVFKNGYRPDSASSVVLQEGIRPKKGSRVLILGAGTGADAILAARRGAGEVIATDIGLIEVICARYNVEKSGYKDRITVIQADLFNIPERLKKKKFTHIYFNMPLGPDMALLDRLLNEAGNYLEEGGTLEITYEENPFFLEKVYSKGWEPIRIEGVNYMREKVKWLSIDYGRFVLVRQKDIPNRKVEISELCRYWKKLAEIMRLYDNGKESFQDKMKVLDEIRNKYADSDDFNAQLLIKGVNDLLRYIDGHPQKEPIIEPRINKLYPEYITEVEKGSGAIEELDQAIKELEAFLNQAGEVPQPDFVDFGWEREQITRKFIQKKLPEILELAQDEQIVAHRLPDGRLRFTKLEVKYFSKPGSDKVYREAKLAQRFYELGYVKGTGEDNKYIAPTEKLIKEWEDAQESLLYRVWVKGYLIKLARLGKKWELENIEDCITGEKEIYISGVFQRIEEAAKKVADSMLKLIPAKKVKKIPSLKDQISIAINRLERPILNTIKEYINDEWGTEVKDEDILEAVDSRNKIRREMGQKEIVIYKEVEEIGEEKKAEEVRLAQKEGVVKESIENVLTRLVKKEKNELIEMLGGLKWNLSEFHKYIAGIVKRKRVSLPALLRGLNLVDDFLEKYKEIYLWYGGNENKIIEYFGLSWKSHENLKKTFHLEKLKELPLGEPKLFSPEADLKKEKAVALKLLKQNNWDLKKLHDYYKKVLEHERIKLSALLKELDLAAEFQEEFNRVYIEKFGVIEEVIKYFNISWGIYYDIKESLGITEPEVEFPKKSKKLDIVMDKKEILALAEKMDWNLRKLHDHIAALFNRGMIPLPVLLNSSGLVEEFGEKYREICRINIGILKLTAEYFGITVFTLKSLTKTLEIEEPEDIPVESGMLLPIVKKTKKEILELLKNNNWNLGELYRELGLRSIGIRMADLVVGLDIEDEFNEEFKKVYTLKQGKLKAIAGYFGIAVDVLKDIIKYLEVDVSEIELFEEGTILEACGLKKEDILNELNREDIKWNLGLFRDNFIEKNNVFRGISYPVLVKGLGISKEFLSKFDQICEANQGNLTKTAEIFGLRCDQLRDLLAQLGRKEYETTGIASFARGELLKATGMTKEGIIEIIKQKKWKFPEIIKYFKEKDWIKKRVRIINFIIGLDIDKEFEEEFIKIYKDSKGRKDITSDYFGLNTYTLFGIVEGLKINLDILEPEGQKKFNNIIYEYAQELEKGKSIDDMQKATERLIKGFSGWDTKAEVNEIKTKYMGSNTLVFTGLENKEYKILFEWHKIMGLVAVIKEAGKDEKEDIIYNLRDCKNYDKKGIYKKISAHNMGKRVETKKIEFNLIIEQYARMLKEGKTLKQIKDALLNAIQEFGYMEKEEIGVLSFATTPISVSYNALVFDRIYAGKLYSRFLWDDFVGLLAVFGKEKHDSEEDLIFDASPYADYDLSATKENPKNLYATKIGKRDELNVERLNRVILKYANFLRKNRKLEEIKEEIREDMELLGRFKRIITAGSFSQTPSTNNPLHYNQLPGGTYDIGLEWLEDLGMVTVFSMEETDKRRDLVYDVSVYKDYDLSAKKIYFTAQKLGERGKLAFLIYLSRLVLKYAMYLKQKVPMSEIKEFLDEDIKKFGTKEILLDCKSFTISPVDKNSLIFLGLSPGLYDISVEWNEKYGLIVKVTSKDESKKMQIYSVNNYKNFDLSEKEQKPMTANIITGIILGKRREGKEKEVVEELPLKEEEVTPEEKPKPEKGEINKGTPAKLEGRECIIYLEPVLTTVTKIYLQFLDGKIEEHVIGKILEKLQIYDKKCKDWFLINEFMEVPFEKESVSKMPEKPLISKKKEVKKPEYPILKQKTKLRDEKGNIYILLGPLYCKREEVLLSPDNILVLKPEKGGELVRVPVENVVKNNWDVLEDEEYPELDYSWDKVTDIISDYKDEKPTGSMKNIGRRSELDEDNIRLMKERQDKLEKKVDRLGIKTIIIKDLEITAKFISSSSLLPKGLSAWHFYDKRNNLVIVTRPEFQDEGIYHEAREAFWIKENINNEINVYEMDHEELERKIKEIRHKAHIIASAEQVLAFSENGRLAPFHKSQLDNMSPLELRALMREHDEYDVDNRKSYHYKIIHKYLGKNKYKKIKVYENLFRLRILLKLLKINKEIKKEFPMSKKGKTILLNSLISCTDEEVNELYRKVSDIEGFEIRDRCALKKILFQWFDHQQLTSALRVHNETMRDRVEVGDITAFVSVKGHRMYHPLIAIQEYVDYKENKNIIVKERYLKSSIEGLSNGSFKELIEFIEDEAGKKIKIDNINDNYDEIIAEVLNVCKTLFNINSFSRYLGLNKRSTTMLIRRLKLKKIDLKPKKGKSFTLMSPQGAARIKVMREGLIKDVKEWYKDNFGEDIEFNNLYDFKEWSGDSEFIVTFPFICIDSVKNIPGLKIYEVKDEYRLTNQKYYIPPIEIERLKNEVISLVKDPEVLPLLRKYKLLPDNMPIDNLDYEKAKGIIMEIKDKWLTILRFAKEIGYGKDLIYDLIERKEIDYIKLKIFTNQFVYYIPPENIEVLKNRDREELEKAKKFLEEVCNVYVFSIEHVKGLLEKHCMTTPQIVKRLGCKELTHTSERPNTVVLKFTGNPFLLVYWKKEDAERFIENEKRKFKELKGQVSKYSDVTNISTPKKLIKLLKKEWKTPKQAMDLLNLSYNKVMHRVYKKKFPSVIMNLAGFGKRVYIYLPSGKGKIWAKGSGSLKDIGLPLSEEVIKGMKGKEPGWRKIAKNIVLKQYKIKNILTPAKVIQVSDLPQGLNAWHLREEDGTFVIIVRALNVIASEPFAIARGRLRERSNPDEIASSVVPIKSGLLPRNDSLLDEVIYHEYREDYWMNQGLTQREAHILASAEEALAFADESGLTTYHQSQLKNMPIFKLQEIIKEDRSSNYKIIKNYLVPELGAGVLEKIVQYEYFVKISCLEEINKRSNEINGELSNLAGDVQEINKLSRLQFAVPFEVIKNAGDFTLALKKIGLLGKGNTIFELIIYDVDNKWDGDEFIKLLNLSKNIRVYTVKRGEINDSSDILQVKDFMQKSYPLRKKENGHLMIATNMMDEDATESFKNRIKGKLDKNTSVGIIVKPDEKSIISLSRILADLLDGKGKDGESIIKIILPVSLSPGEIKKQLEEDLKVIWGLLTSA